MSAAGLPHKLPQPEGTDNGRLEKKKKREQARSHAMCEGEEGHNK